MDKIVSFSNWLKVIKSNTKPTTSVSVSVSAFYSKAKSDDEPPRKKQKLSHHSPLAVDGVVEQLITQDNKESIPVIAGEEIEMVEIHDYEFGAPLKRVPTPYPRGKKDLDDDDDEDEENEQ
ncbi:hypothetical protein AbraIFM66950_005159 [Aspergillus brasiliensis]|nr:hypothetical protein AbraIFM66950_005159 [Aspergillus brasiliensis]